MTNKMRQNGQLACFFTYFHIARDINCLESRGHETNGQRFVVALKAINRSMPRSQPDFQLGKHRFSVQLVEDFVIQGVKAAGGHHR